MDGSATLFAASVALCAELDAREGKLFASIAADANYVRRADAELAGKNRLSFQFPVYSLHLICHPQDVDQISAELWELDTTGIRELDESHAVHLIAGFESNQHRELLLSRFTANSPAWLHENDTDWAQFTRDAWPPRLVGERFFLCAPWCEDATPAGRLRLYRIPGSLAAQANILAPKWPSAHSSVQ